MVKRSLSLLVIFLGAPVVWALHLSVSYLVVAVECGGGWSGAETVVLVATAVGAAASVAAGVVGWRVWRRARPEEAGRPHDTQPARDFLALSGAALAVLFTAAIVLAGIVPLFLPTCS